jgi:hypothetical protein
MEDRLDRLEKLIQNLVGKVTSLDKKVDEVLYEDDSYVEEYNEPNRHRIDSDDDIYKHGQKVPYNKLSGNDMYDFRDFIKYIRMHEHDFTEKEFDYAGFSDKNFRDVRISDNARRVLGNAYQKMYRKPMPFRWVRGYLYKLDGQNAWEWNDGTRD